MKHWGKDVLITRRGLIGVGAGLLVAQAARADLLITPEQTTGPFYPHEIPPDSDMDLTIINGRSGTAQGRAIELAGRVLAVKGYPLKGAIVEIWQADSRGIYNHPFERNRRSRDDNFQGFGSVKVGADGFYRFRTIKPRFYDTGAGLRTPHIHYRVVTADRRELVTQMYFPGEPMNRQDGIYLGLQSKAVQAAATARLIGVKGGFNQYRYDLVIA